MQTQSLVTILNEVQEDLLDATTKIDIVRDQLEHGKILIDEDQGGDNESVTGNL